MNIKQLTSAIRILPSHKSIMLKGTHGIGKTEWVKSLAEKLGLKLVIWHASHAADAGDITGLPFKITEVQDDGTSVEVTKFAKPQWMIQNSPVLLLLDEINRGMSIALNAIMQLTNDGTYDDISLPAGSRIFACINPDEDGKYDVGSMDAAQLDRFAIYEFKPTTQEWIDWAVQKGLDSRVTGYIQSHPSMLDPYTNQELVKSVAGKDCGVLPSRRSWEVVSEVIINGDREQMWETADGIALLTEMLNGIVGTGATIDFVSYFKSAGNALTPKQIMEAADFNKKLIDSIKKMGKNDFPAVSKLVAGCTLYLQENVDKMTAAHAHNFYMLLNSLTPDAKTAAVKECMLSAIEKQADWAKKLSHLEKNLKPLYMEALIGKNSEV